MNKEDLIKWGAVGVVAYLAWPYVQDMLGKLGVPVGAASVTPTPAVSTTPTIATTPAITGKITDQAPVPDPNAALLRAMTDEQVAGAAAAVGAANMVAEADRRGLKMTHHQWNWYRQQYTGKVQPDPELWAPGTSTSQVTVDQYLAARRTAGMAGMEAYRVHPSLMWIT